MAEPMKLFRADLHVHTVLSPCGSLDMAPERIVKMAVDRGMDVIAITDHNSTRQCQEVMEVASSQGLLVIGGAEINTREEVHCLTFFENQALLAEFQKYLDQWLPNIPNNPAKWGHQVWVNRQEEILGEEHRLLWSALNQSIEEVAQAVHNLGGIFIPAHVNRPVFGLFSQLGFMPDGLQVDALEVTAGVELDFLRKTGVHTNYHLITGSDAHAPEQIGNAFTWLRMREPSFSELKMAIRGLEGRKAWPNNPLLQEGAEL
jgi:3',5'-nucleoside bisphosphate phosphatase